MHKMIAWFAKNDVAANLLMVFIALSGLYALTSRIPLEVFPDFNLDRITVSASLPGASPQEVEEGISIRIEEAVQDLVGIKQITSRSSENSATVSIEVDSSVEPRDLLDDVKSRVDSISSFPDSMERPRIALAQRQREVISAVIYGNVDELTIKNLAEEIRDDLTATPGITQVEISGTRNYEISIEIPELNLRQYGLTLAQVADAVRQSSLDMSAGNIKTKGGEIFVRTRNQAFVGQDFADITVLSRPNGSEIKLSDIAIINDGFEESPVRTRFNGQPAAEIEVYRVGNQSAIEVADLVKDYIDAKQTQLPYGVSLGFWRDRSKVVKARLSTLTYSAIQGLALVFILLTLFLRPAVAFWVCVGIPISFMGAFAIMPEMGVTLNLLSLFAFIVVLGIVVDDAIVTGENVYTHLQRGASPIDAAIKGTQEVAVPVTFGVLTTIAAFVPLAIMEGRMSVFFTQIPFVVIPVLLFSLVESKLVLPAHMKHIKIRPVEKMNKLQRIQKSISSGLESFVKRFYQPALKKVLEFRYTALMGIIGLSIVTITMVTAGFTKFIFFPRIQSEVATASLTMPVGTSFEITDRYIQQINAAAQKLQKEYTDESTGDSVIMNVFSSTGSRGGQSNSGRVRFEIMPPETRTIDVTSRQLVNRWREMVGIIPGAESLNYRAEIGRSSSPIDVQMSGTDIRQLEPFAALVRERLETYPEIFDIEDSLSNGKEELQFLLKPEAQHLGIRLQDLARQVRQAFFGFEVQRIQRSRDEVRVYVRYPKHDRESLATLDNLMIKLNDGSQVAFSDIATVSAARSPNSIDRVDRRRTVSVRADVDKQAGNTGIIMADLNQYMQELLPQYPNVRVELAGEAKDQKESNTSLIYGTIFVLFAIFTLLAIPFKSYVQPLIVMTVIPFGAIGAIWGHWLMGISMSVMSLMGILALSGVVVNDSLVLVDYINKKRRGGLSLRKAIETAGGARFRPVMLTSLTTFTGLMPLLFETSTQAQFLIPMAVSLGFGILFATVITLFLVPVNYLILEDVKRFCIWIKSLMLGKPQDIQEVPADQEK